MLLSYDYLWLTAGEDDRLLLGKVGQCMQLILVFDSHWLVTAYLADLVFDGAFKHWVRLAAYFLKEVFLYGSNKMY